jgi:hypothetical protein
LARRMTAADGHTAAAGLPSRGVWFGWALTISRKEKEGVRSAIKVARDWPLAFGFSGVASA